MMFDFSGKQLFFDGGMGTMLQRYGMKPGEASDMQNLINSEAVVRIHREYIEVGADILTANTLGAYSLHYDNADEIITAGVAHMKEAMGQERKLMALDMGPTGQLLEPYGDFSYDDCYKVFLQAAKAGAVAGVDLILIETMIDLNEMKAAVEAAKTTRLPVVATMTFDKNGRTMMGNTIADMVREMEKLEVDVIGMNCGHGPELYAEFLPQLAELTSLPILVQPNAGLPELVDGKTVYSVTPEEFAKSMLPIAKQAQLLGGCCGTTPEHMKAMIKLCRT